MKKRVITLLMLPALLAGAIVSCDDDDPTGPSNITYTATLNNANELANAQGNKPNTGATGTWQGVLNPTTNVMTWTLSFTGLSANSTGAHIHAQAPTTANAGIVLNFANAPAGGNFATGTTSGTFTGSVNMLGGGVTGFTITGDSLRKAMDAGQAYVNVHSGNWTGGEIRGQIVKQ